MYITWHGQACFKIQGKETVIITDPYENKIGLKLPRLNGAIVTVSHDHYDHNNITAIGGDPFVISIPGEYEVQGIFIQGLTSWHDNKEGADRGKNTIFIFEIEEIKIAHLGDLGTTLSDQQLEKLERIDILLIPVGGTYTIDAKQAAAVVSQIEPRIVIPMHYKIPGLNIKLQNAEPFCNEMGVKKNEAEDKLKITKKELPAEETKVILLKP
ncbi:MBL fold metallo-hydrolase [Patescibacteria group bacterium]|nr:MBL fold metallo-hydrolase [Patescibacteria group bacterium]